MTDDAALIAIPMRSTVGAHAGECLGPTRMTVSLTKPLGHRTLYDAGSLPIRGATGADDGHTFGRDAGGPRGRSCALQLLASATPGAASQVRLEHSTHVV